MPEGALSASVESARGFTAGPQPHTHDGTRIIDLVRAVRPKKPGIW